jgi:ParB/RepB/Spo0J family partition protein
MLFGRKSESPFVMVPVRKITTHRYQMRRQLCKDVVDALAESIRKNGLICPIVLRPLGNEYELICGQLRLLACRRAGLEDVPALVRDLSETEALELALQDNLMRCELSLVERAEAFESFAANVPEAQREAVAEKLGLGRGFPDLSRRIVMLPQLLKEALMMGLMSLPHATELAKIPDAKLLEQTVAQVRKDDLSAKATARLVEEVLNEEVRKARRAQSEAIARADDLIDPVAKLLDDFSRDEPLDYNVLRTVVSRLRAAMRKVPGEMLDLSYSEVPEKYLPRHCLNVAKLAMYVGKNYGYDDSDIAMLGICGLLHDVGMVRVSQSVFYKHDELDERERTEVIGHPRGGSALLSKEVLLEDVVAEVCEKHHERLDGTGYPEGHGASTGGVHTFVKIINIVDSYEAMISPRTYKRHMTPHAAMRQIVREADSGGFDKTVARAFLKCMSVYPVGSFVKLSSGESGVVIAPNPDYDERPVIKLVTGVDGKAVNPPMIIELSKWPDRRVAEVLESAPIPL